MDEYLLNIRQAHYNDTHYDAYSLISTNKALFIIGIDHDTVCVGVAAAPAGTRSAVPDCSTDHDSADRKSGQSLIYHDHNLQKVRETCVFDVLYRCSSPSAFA